MKVLFGCPTFYIGGWSTYSLNLSKALRKNGVTTIAFVLEQYGSLYKEFLENFDEVIICSRKLESKANYLKRIISGIKGFAPDVIINNSCPFIQASFEYLNEPVKINTVHSIVKEEIYYGTACLNHLDYVVAVAPNIHSIISHSVKEKAKLIEIGILLNEEVPSKKRNEILELVYVGRLSKEAKNLEMMEPLMVRLSENGIKCKLSFIGSGDYGAELKMKLAGHTFSEDIKFYGNLSHSGVLDVLKNFDIFLLTSTYEGTPHSLLEAMSYKLVPVTSNIKGSTDRIIKNGVNGFLCKINSVEQFYEAIVAMHKDTNLLESMGEAAYQTVAKQYNLMIILNDYLQLFNKKKTAGSLDTNRQKIKVPVELSTGCTGFFRQVKRTLGDLYRKVFYGVNKINTNGKQSTL